LGGLGGWVDGFFWLDKKNILEEEFKKKTITHTTPKTNQLMNNN